MERHEFRAMGTEIELMLDVPPGPAAAQAFSEAEREFGRIEAALSRFLPGSELSALNRSGMVKAGPRPPGRHRARARRPRADRRPVRPDRARRARRRRLRPLLRAGSGRRTESEWQRRSSLRHARGDRPLHPHDQARVRAPASTSEGSARATPSTARPTGSPGSARASSTQAATSPFAAGAGPSASRRRMASLRSSSSPARSRHPGATAGAGAGTARSSTI